MTRFPITTVAGTGIAVALLALHLGAASAQSLGKINGIEFAPLTGVQPPLPDLTGIVVDKTAAIALGKALFWDSAAGSDGQACATCHFHSGADLRIVNQLNPGVRGGNITFGDANGLTKSGAVDGPNYTLKPGDFPLHALADAADRDSAVLYDTMDVVSSSGTFGSPYLRSRPKQDQQRDSQARIPSRYDRCNVATVDPLFHVAAGNTRHVEPRNTPTTINSVFNFRNFWDGRANNIFNGVDPFGPRNTTARIVAAAAGKVQLEPLALANASLASQAVGPPLSDQEMSCAGRAFADLGRKLLPLRPLSGQFIDPSDSILGLRFNFRDVDGKGVRGTYQTVIQRAFATKYWSAPNRYTMTASGLVPDPKGYTQSELNFSMFWGLAIMLYEATLISDQSPYDKFITSRDTSKFGQLEQDGMLVFQGKGGCIGCHKGPTLTSAALTQMPPREVLEQIEESPEDKPIERMPVGDERGTAVALYDNGFYNIGVRPASDDVGVGGVDPWGNPLSFTRQFKKQPGKPGPDRFAVDPCDFSIPDYWCGADMSLADLSDERVAVDGAFKVPTLRNIAQTPPFFHNGGQANLRQVVEFYNRGGDRRALDNSAHSVNATVHDTSGTGQTGEGVGPDGLKYSNGHPDIQPLGLTGYEKDALVAFLQSLTDDRVRCHAAPFDHPQLLMPNGAMNFDLNRDGRADELFLVLKATGGSGIPNCTLPNDGDLFSLNKALVAQAFLPSSALSAADLAALIAKIRTMLLGAAAGTTSPAATTPTNTTTGTTAAGSPTTAATGSNTAVPAPSPAKPATTPPTKSGSNTTTKGKK